MRVGWVHDDPGYVGGAELTMAEFRRAAPCEVVDGTDADVVVVGNVSDAIALRGQRVIHYHHDLNRYPVIADRDIFCSPMQARRLGLEGAHIPPALDLERLQQLNQGQRLMGDREGTVALGPWHNTGKGQQQLLEWSQANEPVDVYGDGPFTPRGSTLDYKGPLPYEEVPRVLSRYRRFVHLPTSPEPFGRSIVEAWYSGCEVVANSLCGALWWLRERPDGLTTAAEDFWNVVLSP